MFIKKIIILLTGLLLLTLYSCSDDPTSVGKGLLNSDQINVHNLDSFTDTISQSSSFTKKVIGLDPSERNLIGKSKNVEASTLINFFILLPDSIKNAFASNDLNITSSTVEFYNTYSFGDSSAPYDFTVHKINSGWTFGGFTADSLSMLSFDQANLSSNKNFTDSLSTFQIDNNLVKEWFQLFVGSAQSSNLGVYVKPTPETQKIVGYQALSIISTNLPTLKVVVEKPGSFVDTLSFLAGSDVSVVEGELPNINSEDLVIQGGLAAQSKIEFDVSKISNKAVINNAALTLNLDTSETLIGQGSVNTLNASFISADTVLFSISLSRSGNTYTGNISSFVERWTKNKNDNEGILLSASDQTSNVDLFAIKGSLSNNLAMRPRLTITYTSR